MLSFYAMSSAATTVLPIAAAPVASTSRLSFDEHHESSPVSTPETQSAPATSDALPPYTRSAAPPPYVEREETGEPNTLARHLFRYGFFFPLFWFVGACILASNLSPPENWEETKTEDERRELIAVMRAAEVC